MGSVVCAEGAQVRGSQLGTRMPPDEAKPDPSWTVAPEGVDQRRQEASVSKDPGSSLPPVSPAPPEGKKRKKFWEAKHLSSRGT